MGLITMKDESSSKLFYICLNNQTHAATRAISENTHDDYRFILLYSMSLPKHKLT